MSSIAIITARGGSKRIPKKNIKEFCGEPIIAYSIKAAIGSGMFDEVMVSTDSLEIKEIAVKYGAKVPFLRSEATSNDYATTADVIKEVICEYEKLDRKFNYGCCIYPTAPFITDKKLVEAMEKLKSGGFHSVVPVVQYSFPPQRAFVIEDDNLKYLYPEYMNSRSQDLEPIFHDCGQFYCFDIQAFLASGKIVGPKSSAIIMSELQVQDIDNETDWKLAELKYRLNNQGE